MEATLYSQSLERYGQDIKNPDLIHSLNSLKEYMGGSLPPFLKWDEYKFAIPLTIPVSLPPHGPIDNLDIRDQEPVLLVLDEDDYPGIPPRVHPDRLDFPASNTGHLYVAKDDKPPALCLVRGKASEWYADKQLKDVVIRAANFFRDAATGQLNENGGQFEPLRLDGYNGGLIYDYDAIADLVLKKNALVLKGNFAVGIFERVTVDNGIYWRLINVIKDKEDGKKSIDQVDAETNKEETDKTKRHLYYGYIVWSEDETEYTHYDAKLPSTWGALKSYLAQYGIDLSGVEDFVAGIDFNEYYSVPLIAAIKRPLPLIGFNSNYELANFHFRHDRVAIEDGKLSDDLEVKFKEHEQLLTPERAKSISGFAANITRRSLFVGLGALGGRVAMHLIKSGTVKLSLSDSDTLASHNFVRHPLSVKYAGLKKSSAIIEEAKLLYPNVGAAELIFKITTTKEKLSAASYEWIFDFTASPLFMQELVNATPEEKTKIAKGYISDFGNLGILFMEGAGRNPRVDDLQAMLYAEALHNKDVAEWLGREADATSNSTLVTVGVGCNTETTILSDDIIAVHGGVMSGIIKTETLQSQVHGRIYLNAISKTPFFQNTVKQINVAPFTVHPALNDPSWQVRYMPGLIEKLHEQMYKKSPRETGGILIGSFNYKTRTIHVMDSIDAPPDSKASKSRFIRGEKGLPDAISEVNRRTGNQVDYIGEWHSHPKGPDSLSELDLDTIQRFKNEYKNLPSPFPVFLTIVTPNKTLPYVF